LLVSVDLFDRKVRSQLQISLNNGITWPPRQLSTTRTHILLAFHAIDFFWKCLPALQSKICCSTCTSRYVLGKFHGRRVPTVGADFLSKKLLIDDVDVTIQIWGKLHASDHDHSTIPVIVCITVDTAGQERFNQSTLGASFYRGAHGALLVYDVTNGKSFEQVSLWCDEVMNKIEPGTYFPIVVVGNKVDLRDNNSDNHADYVDQNAVVAWCQQHTYGHVETSVKDNLGVEAAMTTMAALALEAHRVNLRLGSDKPSKSGNIKLSDMYQEKSRGVCC
jgi:Ras-related protein Rab-7A